MFTRLSIPTPFQVGPVNAYLAGRTLVDPGPGSEEAWASVLDELEAQNLAPSDIEQVVVTHPHPDHFGLASRFREDGARVLASAATANIIADFEERLASEQEYFVDFFEQNGMARTTAQTVTDLPESFISFSPGVDTDRELADGDTFEVNGTTITTTVVTGHAPEELVLAYETDGRREAIVGDHVLNEITPNPLLQPPAEDGTRPRVLPAYNDSLERLRDAGFDRLLPGHRTPIDDPAGRINDILDAHEDRTENVQSLVDGPTTAVDVMNDLFGDLPMTEYFPAMSEAVGHLDVLEARGDVEQHENGGMIVYEQVTA